MNVRIYPAIHPLEESSLKYTGTVYRPPLEADSLILQVTIGCSHNKCSFCTMYRDTPFQMESIAQIEQDLDEASAYAPYFDRVFLVGGDPFALSASRLTEIAERIHQKLPGVKTIATYASIRNIRTKTDDELCRLQELGYNDLNIGVESGYDPALKYMNKGYTAKEAEKELLRLRKAGIDFCMNVIFGAAGSGLRRENALATAELINKTQPAIILTTNLHADPGCPLYDDLQSGAFTENSVADYLDEMEILTEHLELENSRYFGLHTSNIVPMDAHLPRDKALMLREIRSSRQRFSKETLASHPRRFSEGAVQL